MGCHLGVSCSLLDVPVELETAFHIMLCKMKIKYVYL